MRALRKLRGVFDNADVPSMEERLAVIEGQVVRLLAAQVERDAAEVARSTGARRLADACKEMLANVPEAGSRPQ